MFRHKARWYVYELVDPRNGAPFYVGKGTNNRIDHHEREANAGVCFHKCNKIRSITSSGNKIIKSKVAYFWDEKAAYEYEAQRILSYGLDALTNVVIGSPYSLRNLIKQNDPEQISKDCMKIIKTWPGQFAYWLLHSECGKRKAAVTGLTPVYKALLEAFYNKLAYSTFSAAVKDKKNRDEVKKIFSEYGIDVVFDGG